MFFSDLFEDVQGPNATADSHILIGGYDLICISLSATAWWYSCCFDFYFVSTGDQKSANIAEALLKKTFVVIYKFNVFTTKYSNIFITFLDGVLFSTLERQVTEQFLYNKTMDQDTWFNDYKSIGEAGYRFCPLLLFLLLLHLIKKVEEFQDLCGGKCCWRDRWHCFLHTR